MNESAGTEIVEEEVADERDAEEEGALPTYSITAYGADYPVDGLVKRLDAGDIVIPSFQRGYVWSKGQADRFIESLLLGLPVPGIFLSKEPNSNKLIVIDGQQRLRTLEFFYSGLFQGREYRLSGVNPAFDGKTYKTLEDEDRRRLDDTIIHATIVRQEKPSEDDSGIHHIFKRLNTGGTALQPQEIRASIYQGSFNELLGELDETNEWREIYGNPSKRLKDQELILRFLALYLDADSYTRPMQEFLNNFMGRNRHLDDSRAEEFRNAFVNTVRTIHGAVGKQAFRPEGALNAALFDAVMVGVARRLAVGPIDDRSGLASGYSELLSDGRFEQAYKRATSDDESVRTRLRLATEAFSSLA